MSAPELILIITVEVVLVAMGVRALQLISSRDPRLRDVYRRASDRMHERPWLLYRIPLALSAWGAVAGVWDVATSNGVTEATLRFVFPLLAAIAVTLTIRVWRLHSAEERR